MLVLTRKIGERIMIGEDIVITLAKIRGDTVRIGIDAPKKVRILRGELLSDDKSSKESFRPQKAD